MRAALTAGLSANTGNEEEEGCGFKTVTCAGKLGVQLSGK